MAGLIKLIFSLIFLTGVAVYGGDIWNGAKDKIVQFTNPELQRASIFDSFKNNSSEIENKIKEVKDNINNPDFDEKTKLGEISNLIKESKNNLSKIESSDSTLIEKGFEALNDIKQGAQNLFSTNTNQCEIK